MASVNKVILVGNLGADPEIKTTQGGHKYVNLSMATTKRWRDKDGEKREKTTWHRVVVYHKALVEVAEKYFKKGTAVFVEGELDTREFMDGDKKRYITEVLVNGFSCRLFSTEKAEGRPAVPDRDDEDFAGEIPFGRGEGEEA